MTRPRRTVSTYVPPAELIKRLKSDDEHFSRNLFSAVKMLKAMLSFADNESGGSIWASVATMAKKAGLSHRTGQRLVAAFLEHGYIEYEPGVGRRPNCYRMPRVGGSAPAPKPVADEVRCYVNNDVTNEAAVTSPVTPDLIKSKSRSRSRAKSKTKTPAKKSAGDGDFGLRPRKKRLTFAEWDRTPDPTVFAYADRIRLPREFVRVAFAVFAAYYTKPQNAQHRPHDWNQIFLEYLRRAEHGLWTASESGYTLTTRGYQAAREHGIALPHTGKRERVDSHGYVLDEHGNRTGERKPVV